MKNQTLTRTLLTAGGGGLKLTSVGSIQASAM